MPCLNAFSIWVILQRQDKSFLKCWFKINAYTIGTWVACTVESSMKDERERWKLQNRKEDKDRFDKKKEYCIHNNLFISLEYNHIETRLVRVYVLHNMEHKILNGALCNLLSLHVAGL